MMKKTNIIRLFLYVNLLCLFGLIFFPSPSRSQLWSIHDETIQSLESSTQQNIIVSMGDSITACYCVNSSECYVPKLSSLSGIFAYNLGVGGASSRDGRSSIDQILYLYNPQLLTIFFGTNDAHQDAIVAEEVYYNLQYMVRQCISRGTRPILATIGPQFNYYYKYKPKIDYINQLIRKLASEESIPLADIGSALNWNPSYMCDDTHPDRVGHEIIARTFYQAMIAGCTYSISPTSAWVSGSSGSGSVSVTASEDACPWTAVSHDDWITVTAGSSGTGNGTVIYSYTANTGMSSRTGTITIAGKTFTLAQKKMAGLPWLMLLME